MKNKTLSATEDKKIYRRKSYLKKIDIIRDKTLGLIRDLLRLTKKRTNAQL